MALFWIARSSRPHPDGYLFYFLFQYLAFRDQARTLRETVRVANEQSTTMRQENNKNAFFDLIPELDHLIKPDEKFMREFDDKRDEKIENTFIALNFKDQNNVEFLKWFSDQLKGISESDHFRRNSLFGAFARLYDDADTTRKELFRDALCARIGDEFARFIILQAIREKDDKMLEIFGKFPLAFENLWRMPYLMRNLVYRFAPSFVDEIWKKAEVLINAAQEGKVNASSSS